MKKKDIEKIVAMMENDKTAHLMFIEHDDSLACSLRCTGEDLYVYLRMLLEIQPDFGEVIRAVAMESVEMSVDDTLVN